MSEMRVVCFKADEDLLEALEEAAKRKNTSKSELIRAALRAFLSEKKSEPFVSRRLRVW